MPQERAAAGTTWHPTVSLSELPEDGTGRTVEVAGQSVALFRIEGELHAVDATCPHRGASLGEGVVVDGDVACPWHSFHFDLRTGCNTDGLSELSIGVHAVRARADGVVEVALASEPADAP